MTNPIDLIRRLADALEAAHTGHAYDASLPEQARTFLARARVIEVPECAVRGLSDNLGRPYQSLFRTDSDDTEHWREPVLNGDPGDVEARALADCEPGPCAVYVVVVPGGEK